MKYYLDFKEMVNGTFIDRSKFSVESDEDYNFIREVEEYERYFKSLNNHQTQLLDEVLIKMSELACYKTVIKTKISPVIVSDSNDENKYLQVRGVATFEKEKRVWVNVYVDKLGSQDSINLKDVASPQMVREFKGKVLLKLVAKLKALVRERRG